MSSVNTHIKKLYYSISEVSKITGLKQYVLRYWETEFSQLKPPKNRAGNRTYRQKDIDVIETIRDLLYNKKFTIDGARKQLESPDESSKLYSEEDAKQSSTINAELLDKLKQELREIIKIIKE